MSAYKKDRRVYDILNQQLRVDNATVDKTYKHKIDFEKLGWSDIVFSNIIGLQNLGLEYDKESKVISGQPNKSGYYNPCQFPSVSRI